MSTGERANFSFAILVSQSLHLDYAERMVVVGCGVQSTRNCSGDGSSCGGALKPLSLSFDVKTPWCVDSVCYRRCVSQPKAPAVVLFPEPTYRGVEH